jgi:cysteine desulfurase/selenocysteine lyase
MFDPIKIREEFPIFQRKIKGNSLIYLDSAATTQKPICVIDALSDFYKYQYANVHRGAYSLSDDATYKYEEARLKVAKFINAKMTENIIFTRNATEGINLVASSWGRKNLKSGDEILLTMMEHHSNLIPWQIIAKEKSAKLKFIELTPDGRLDLSNINTLITVGQKLSLSFISPMLWGRLIR